MNGFKHTGRGPKSGHSFSSKAGFTGSTGRTQSVRGYTRTVPKKKFANGGMVVARGTDGGSALTRRTQPITGFDQEAGGRSPLRPGFKRGGAMINTVGRTATPATGVAPRGALAGALAGGKGNRGFTPAPQTQKEPGFVSNHGNPGGYGSFGRSPRIFT